MPTYQYACTECSHAFEQFQSFSDDALTVCPQCQGRLRKVYNAVGVVFKGSGFYRTDSRADAKAGAAGSDAPKGGSDSSANDSSTSTGESSKSRSDSSTSTGATSTTAATGPSTGAGSTSAA